MTHISEAHRESIPKAIARYSSSNIFKQLTRLANAFIKPKLLEPHLYGLWNLIGLFIFYSTYSNLGSRNAMLFLVPFHKGKNEHHKAIEVKSNVFYGTLYINASIALIMLIYVFITNLDIKIRLGILTLALLLIIDWYRDYYIADIQSEQNFMILSSKNFLESTVSVVLSALLLYFFNIYGLYLSITLTGLIVIFFLRTRYTLRLHLRFDYKTFFALVRKGFPIMVYSFSMALIISIDRIIIFTFLGDTFLGYYGIAVAIFDFLMQIPTASRDVIEPRLMHSLSKNTVDESLKQYLFKPQINTAYLMPFLIGPIFFFTPVFINLLLPKYIPGVLSAQITIIGVFFLSMTSIIRGIIVANNWQFRSLMVLASVLSLKIVLSVIFIKTGFGLEGVAVSNVITYFILFIGLMLFVFTKLDFHITFWIKTILNLILPFIFMCVTILILQYISVVLSLNLYVTFVINLFLFCIVMLVINYFARKRYPLLKGIKLRDIL